jgi:hypothetical protein
MTTHNGNIGLARRYAKQDDLICILFGCSIPVLLWPRSNHGYEVIGEYYIQDFINGEAIKRVKGGKYKQETFDIY